MAGPVQGKLIADFASFYDACAKAEVSLKSFESESSRVEKQLNKMTDQFSGRRVIQEATQMAEVFDRMGGRAAFTDSELARMGATGAEAVAKMKALGIEVPPGIQKIADEAKKADTTHKDWTGTIKGLALGFAGMFTARAAFNFVNQTVAEAGALKDLAQQTHINVEELQIMAGAMSEFGVEADTLARGIFTLSRKIAGEDESVEKALKKMGLSLAEVKDLDGQELFLKIEAGLAKLQGGLRDDVSAEIFGDRLGRAMAGASEGIEGAIATWRAHNKVISEEAVAALDAYDEAIKRSEKSLQAMVANTLGPLAEGFNHLNDAANSGATGWDFLKANLLDNLDAITGLGTGTEHLASLMDEMNQKAQQRAQVAKAETEVVIQQTDAVDTAATAWNAAAAAADAAAKSNAAFEASLPVKDTKEFTRAVSDAAAAEEIYRSNAKFTTEVIAERIDVLKAVADAAAAAKAANDAFMDAPTLNDRENPSTTHNISTLSGIALENVVSRFNEAGDQSQAQALERALAQLEAQEGRYRVTDNLSYFAMLRDQVLLAQLRALKDSGAIPGFADGVENFDGGLARVHKDELLVNLPPGTDVIPAGRGGGGVTNHFTLNLSGMVGDKVALGRYLEQALLALARSKGQTFGALA